MNKYMLATKATHGGHNVGSDVLDICYIHGEDGDSYIGNWVYGYGLVNVKFPKTTTRDLTPEEIEEWHGKAVEMSGLVSFIDIKGEDLPKRVSVQKEGEAEVKLGQPRTPIKVGKSMYFLFDDYRTLHTTKIQKIEGDRYFTKNSVYIVKVV